MNKQNFDNIEMHGTNVIKRINPNICVSQFVAMVIHQMLKAKCRVCVPEIYTEAQKQ